MGFRYIDDIVQEDMKKKQQMEETMADLKLNNEIISAISKMYRIIYRMDLIMIPMRRFPAKNPCTV